LIRQEVFYTLKQTNAAWTDPDGAFGAWGWVSGYLAPFLRRTTVACRSVRRSNNGLFSILPTTKSSIGGKFRKTKFADKHLVLGVVSIFLSLGVRLTCE
jgi:hypothetical protein